MKPRSTTELEPWEGIPGWIEPPGSSRYRDAQLRQLRQAVFWFLLVLVLLGALGWPFIYHAATDGNSAGAAPFRHARP